MSLLTNYNSHVIWTEKPLGNWAVSNSPGGSPGLNMNLISARRLLSDWLWIRCQFFVEERREISDLFGDFCELIR